MTTKLARSQLRYLKDWEPAILVEFDDWVGDLVGQLRSDGRVLLSVMESSAGMLTVWCGTPAASKGREGWSIQFDASAADVNAWMGERDSRGGTWWLITKHESETNGVALEVSRDGSLTGVVCGA